MQARCPENRKSSNNANQITGIWSMSPYNGPPSLEDLLEFRLLFIVSFLLKNHYESEYTDSRSIP